MSTNSTTALPPLADIPALPVNAGNELVFASPWEARAFALIVHLHQGGHFTWPEWAARLSTELKAAGATDSGADYYRHWLAAAEKLVADKTPLDSEELIARRQALETAQGGPAPAR